MPEDVAVPLREALGWGLSSLTVLWSRMIPLAAVRDLIALGRQRAVELAVGGEVCLGIRS